MKSKLQLGALALLIFSACRQPDTAEFDEVTPSAGGKGTGASSGSGAKSGDGSGASTGSGATSGTETGGAETGGSQSVAGTAPSTGGSSDMPAAGNGGGPAGGTANTPDPTDAGAPNVTGGTSGTGSMSGASGKGGTGATPEPTCGNGVIDADEECDDSGHTGEDGCNADCKVTCDDFGSDATESDDHHCYNGFDEGTFPVAREACMKRGGHLATIASADENQIVRKYVNNSKWIGAFEDVSASTRGRQTYAWITGEPFDYTNWAKREPNGAAVWCTSGILLSCYEHCVTMERDGAWADASCDIPDGYVCEWDPPGRK